MVSKQHPPLTEEEHKQEVIALALGYKIVMASPERYSYWYDPSGKYIGGGSRNALPLWYSSLDAFAQAVNLMKTDGCWERYHRHLDEIMTNIRIGVSAEMFWFMSHNADIKFRFEALYRTFAQA